MSVKLVAITKPLIKGIPDADSFIAYAARVSNPANQLNTMSAPKLINYCIRKQHWSVFETVSATMEIETTLDIATQILRHRSFSFQQFSGRYADPTKELGHTIREARMQDEKNRQNSLPCNDPNITEVWEDWQKQLISETHQAYKWAVENGIAKEQARAVLMNGCTNTRLYMTGSLRSWITYINVRTEEGVQLEHRQLAFEVKREILEHFPSLKNYYEEEYKEILRWTFTNLSYIKPVMPAGMMKNEKEKIGKKR